MQHVALGDLVHTEWRRDDKKRSTPNINDPAALLIQQSSDALATYALNKRRHGRYDIPPHSDICILNGRPLGTTKLMDPAGQRTCNLPELIHSLANQSHSTLRHALDDKIQFQFISHTTP